MINKWNKLKETVNLLSRERKKMPRERKRYSVNKPIRIENDWYVSSVRWTHSNNQNISIWNKRKCKFNEISFTMCQMTIRCFVLIWIHRTETDRLVDQQRENDDQEWAGDKKECRGNSVWWCERWKCKKSFWFHKFETVDIGDGHLIDFTSLVDHISHYLRRIAATVKKTIHKTIIFHPIVFTCKTSSKLTKATENNAIKHKNIDSHLNVAVSIK